MVGCQKKLADGVRMIAQCSRRNDLGAGCEQKTLFDLPVKADCFGQTLTQCSLFSSLGGGKFLYVRLSATEADHECHATDSHWLNL
jgi:hypothetical protein